MSDHQAVAPQALNQATFEVAQFLGREAMLLDERRFWEWFELLDERVTYEIAMREVRESGKSEWVGGAFRQRDDRAMIELRIKRLFSGHAWAEDPPSRTVRSVGSLLVEASGEDDVWVAHSTLMLYRHRAQDEAGAPLAARRRDLIRFTAAGPRLLARNVMLADVVLTMPNLGVFL